MNDPIVEEARHAGEALFDRFNGDLHAVCEYLRNRSKDQGRAVVSLPPKKPLDPRVAVQSTKKVG